jgi:hypothetical protein
MLIKILVISLFLCIPAIPLHADGKIATIWHVWGSSLTQAQKDVLLTYGDSVSGRGMNRTWLDKRICRGVTNYCLTISTKLPVENTVLKNFSNQGKCQRVGEMEFERVSDPLNGRTIEWIEYTWLPNIPYEFAHESYQVEESTP